MFLDLVPAMEYIPSSLIQLLFSIMGEKLVYYIMWEPDLLKSNAQSSMYKASIEGTHPQPIICTSFKNDHLAAAVNDNEDEVFCKAIYCLLCAVFPALKTLRYCDSNIAAMDKIYYLVKQVDDALIDSQLLFDDQDLFGSIRGVIFLTARKNWKKYLVKQIQKGMMNYLGESISFLIKI